MNRIISISNASNTIRMTSQQIAELTGKRHDNVKRTIETLAEQGVISGPQFEDVKETKGNNREYVTRVFVFDLAHKRDSFVVVAQLSPKFTAALVDRWRELEAQAAATHALPRTYLQALKALTAEVEARRPLQQRYRFVEHISPQMGKKNK